MQRTELEVKAGFSKGEEGTPTKDEIREAGYDVKETDNRIYALSYIDARLPETLDELVELVGGKEEALKLALGTFKVREYFDPERNTMKSILRKEVPAAVKSYLASLKQAASQPFTAFSPEDLEEIPFDYKQSTDGVDEWLAEMV